MCNLLRFYRIARYKQNMRSFYFLCYILSNRPIVQFSWICPLHYFHWLAVYGPRHIISSQAFSYNLWIVSLRITMEKSMRTWPKHIIFWTGTIDGDNDRCQVSGLIPKQKTSSPHGIVSETELKIWTIVTYQKCGNSTQQERNNVMEKSQDWKKLKWLNLLKWEICGKKKSGLRSNLNMKNLATFDVNHYKWIFGT